MHFFKKNGQQHLSMEGSLVLTKKEKLVTYASKSALPFTIKGGESLTICKGGRLRASLTALKFIWSK